MIVSATKISTCSDCMLKYKFGYVDKLPREEKDYFDIGHVFEARVEANLTGNSIPEEKTLSKENNELVDKMVNALFGSNKAMDILKKPHEYQKDYKIDIGEKHQLRVIIDFLFPDLIVDTKTSAGRWDMKKAKESVQPPAYIFGEFIRTGKLKDFTFIITTKHKAPQVQIINLKPTEETIEKFKNKALKTIADIECELFDPTPGVHCRWCDFKDFCKFA